MDVDLALALALAPVVVAYVATLFCSEFVVLDYYYILYYSRSPIVMINTAYR